MAGALDLAHVKDDITDVWLRRRRVADDRSVIKRLDATELAGYNYESL